MLEQVRSLLRSRHLSDAREPLIELASRHGKKPEVVALLARYDRLRGALQEAAARLKSGLRQHPRSGELWLEAGWVEFTLGHGEAAADAMAEDIAPAVSCSQAQLGGVWVGQL